MSFSEFNFHPTEFFVLLIQLKVPFIWCVQYFRYPDNQALEESSPNTRNFGFLFDNWNRQISGTC